MDIDAKTWFGWLRAAQWLVFGMFLGAIEPYKLHGTVANYILTTAIGSLVIATMVYLALAIRTMHRIDAKLDASPKRVFGDSFDRKPE